MRLRKHICENLFEALLSKPRVTCRLGNFPSLHLSGPVNHPHPLAGSAFLNSVSFFYLAQGPSTNSDGEEVNHICRLHWGSSSSLMREWQRKRKKRRRAGRDFSRLTHGLRPLSSLTLWAGQIMCIKPSLLASCLLAVCSYSESAVGPNQEQREHFQGLFALQSIDQILKFGLLSPSHVPDKFSTSNFVCFRDLYPSNISLWF